MTTTYPADPKTLQVLERVVTVLKSIVGGADYFYTVGENAIKGIRLYSEITSFPYDMVYLGPEDRKPEYIPDSLIFKYITVQIEAYVDAEGGESMTKLIKHLRDVTKAINDDMRPGAGAGSLGELAAHAHIGIAETDDGMLAGDGLAAFKLSIVACLSGDWGTL